MSDPDRPGGRGFQDDRDKCGVCGGDGRLENAWGQVAKCPSCHGTGRRMEDTGFRDVTKTKEAHHRQTNKQGQPEPKQTWPTTPDGIKLATQIKESSAIAEDVKARVTREIIEHEVSHGTCTQTFLKKTRKALRLPPPPPR